MSESAITEPAADEPSEAEVESEAKEIDWKAEARKHEQRSKENAARAKANEGAAQRLAEIEEANKTAEQKATERLAEAEKRAADLEAKATRAEIAADRGVPAALIAGPASNSAEDLAAFADALIKFRGDQGSNGLRVPNEGKSPAKQPNSESEFVAGLFGSGD